MKKKIKIIFLLFILFMFIRYNFPFQKYFPVEMNDEYYIKEIKSYKKINDDIILFEIIEIDSDVFVAYHKANYSVDKSLGYAYFKSNENGIHEIAEQSKKTYHCGSNHIYFNNMLKSETQDYFIVLSSNPKLCMIELKNTSYYTDIEVEVTKSPSYNVIKLPTNKGVFSYTFYDKHGNEIK